MRRFSALIALLVTLTGCDAPGPSFDLIIRGGHVYDGMAEEPQRVDVAVNGDRIAALGDLSDSIAPVQINASGLAVAPGFIDVQGQSGTTLLLDGAAESHLRQGITSEIVGGDDSPAFWTTHTADVTALRPYGVAFDWTGFDGYFERLLQRGVTLNVGTLVPLNRTERSEAAIDAAMRRGALGIALTRNAAIADPATTAEIIALARVAAGHDGVFAMAMAGSLDFVLRAIDEAMEVGRDARIRVVLYQPDVTDADATTPGVLLARVRAARAAGVTVLPTATPASDAGDADRAGWFRHSGASVGTQSAALRAEGILARRTAHPRAFGAFPHVLSDYIRENNVLSLGEGIRRMTSAAAVHFGLEGRGIIRVGQVADIVVFDAGAVRDHATLERPHQYATGIHHVVIAGVPVLDATGLTGARPGRALFGRGRALTGRPRS